jgi:uncharacterized membrane protein
MLNTSSFINFIILSYALGPIVAVPYGLRFLHLDPFSIFFSLTLLYLAAIPLIFKFLELGGHRKIYRGSILKKICKTCGIKAEEEVDRIRKTGDDTISYFEKKLGHLGFYFAISVFTFLFGIFWAAIFSYFLKVKRKRAVLAISSGIVFGNFFWVLVISYSLPMIKTEIILLLVVIYLLIYGRKRERDIMRKLGRKFKFIHT